MREEKRKDRHEENRGEKCEGKHRRTQSRGEEREKSGQANRAKEGKRGELSDAPDKAFVGSTAHTTVIYMR